MSDPKTYVHLVQKRFWSKVDVRGPAECWLWTAGLSNDGYGSFYIRGRSRRAHRISWELTHGPISAADSYHGTCVLHRCDVPRCVNPNRLWLGSAGDNNADRSAKGRDADRKGEKHNLAKLTEGAVSEIRRRYAAGGISQQKLADEFGVSQTNIGLIVRRVHWPFVNDGTPVKKGLYRGRERGKYRRGFKN